MHRIGRTRRGVSAASSSQAERYADSDPLPFDLAKAHDLYATLLGPFESLLRGKRLLIVPSGPLTTLPFDVLVTERPSTAIPSDPLAYERAAWLVRRHAIAMLPSVASLRALRRLARASRATSRYAGLRQPSALTDPAATIAGPR